MTDNWSGCRSETDLDEAPGSWMLALLLIVAAIGAWLGRLVIMSAHDAARFSEGSRTALAVWAGLIGALSGFGLAAGVLMAQWLWQVLQLFRPRVPLSSAARWALVTVVMLVFVITSTRGFPAGTLGGKSLQPLAPQILGITFFQGLVAVPGLVGFLALRSLAVSDIQWYEEPRCQILMVVWLRRYLRRLLGVFGLFLSLLVVTTAARRRAVLSLGPRVIYLPESVLLYGLLFAGLLAFFHVLANTAINGRCERLLARFAPVPSPDAADISTPLKRRQDLAVFLGVGDSWQRSFQSGVVVLAPLVTALIGTALPR